MTPDQLKAARAVLGWSRLHLALRSATSEHIVATYEKTGRVARLHDRTKQDDPIAAIRATLEAAGVEFFYAAHAGSTHVETRPMTPDQLRAARALLGWSQTQLGLRSDTSSYLVEKFESKGQVARVYGRPNLTDPLATICTTLEEVGIEFTDGNEPGVRLRKPAGTE